MCLVRVLCYFTSGPYKGNGKRENSLKVKDLLIVSRAYKEGAAFRTPYSKHIKSFLTDNAVCLFPEGKNTNNSLSSSISQNLLALNCSEGISVINR